MTSAQARTCEQYRAEGWTIYLRQDDFITGEQLVVIRQNRATNVDTWYYITIYEDGSITAGIHWPGKRR